MSAPRRPWYPTFPGDFRSDWRLEKLDNRTYGVYRKLIDRLWEAEGAMLPNNDALISRMVGESVKVWRRMKQDLLLAPDTAVFTLTEGATHFFNKRLLQEYELAVDRIERRTSAARARWDKDQGGGEGEQQSGGKKPAKSRPGRPTDRDPQAANSLLLEDGSFHNLYAEDVERLKKLYPSIDVEQELRFMEDWCQSNPTKRKKRTGVKRFMSIWLTNATQKLQLQQQLGVPGRTESLFGSGKPHESAPANGHGQTIDPGMSRLAKLLASAKSTETETEGARH